MNPQLCGKEFTIGPMTVAAAKTGMRSIESTDIRARFDLKQGQEQPPPSAPHDDEDCFCCCAHVLPGLTNHPVGSSDVVSPTPTNDGVIAASAHLNALYHPPRFV